ncbi:GDP-mannose transporter gonst2 [Ranunculus cassubicifolius]
MSTEFKLDSVDSEVPEFVSLNSKPTNGDRGSLVYKILDGFLKKGNRSFINIATDAVRSATVSRFSRSNRARYSSDVSDSIEEDVKREHGLERKSGPLLSGTAYCISSCSMILLNKIVLSGYRFNAGISLMFYQNLISVVCVIMLRLFGVVSTEKLTWKLIRAWLPVNMIFVGMLLTGMYSLKYINIAMVTILKNMTNIMTAVGELYLFKKHQNQKVWTVMFLMVCHFLLT